MSVQDDEKVLAAARAVAEIQDGMLVGLGSGSTSACAVRELGKRVAAGLKITATSTSQATEALAQSLNIPLLPFESLSQVDLTIDGADEIDLQLNAIKGGGGALLREKIIAAASTRMIAIVDSSKVSAQLGTLFRLPIEVLPFAAEFVARALSERGFKAIRRQKPAGTDVLTDQHNCLYDIEVGPITDPVELATWLASLPGCIEHGLFLTEIDELFIGRGSQVEIVTRGPGK